MNDEGEGSAEGRRRALERAVAIDDELERLLEAAAIVAEELAEIDRHPIVVGGLAVAYWADGAETTGDIDVAMPGHPLLDERLARLGLRKEGRVWATADRRVIWERPTDRLPPGWSSVTAELRSGRSIELISLEDAIADRMHSLESTGDLESFGRALTLLGATGLDHHRLQARAQQEGLGRTLQVLTTAAEEVAAGHSFEAFEVHDLFPTVGRRPTI